MPVTDPYPSWSYYPRNVRPPVWATDVVAVVQTAEPDISTSDVLGAGNEHKSDAVLAFLRAGLEGQGFAVEHGKRASEKITRPVLFGDDGKPEVSYDIDAFHDGLGIAVEVEAGRGAQNNADYRDIVRTALLLDADFLTLLMPRNYHFVQNGVPKIKRAYLDSKRQLDAIYTSRRLVLPFTGLLLIGY